MVIATKQLARPSLMIAASRSQILLAGASIHRPEGKLRKPVPFIDEPPIPFDQWIMPVPEERYIKGKKHDFF